VDRPSTSGPSAPPAYGRTNFVLVLMGLALVLLSALWRWSQGSGQSAGEQLSLTSVAALLVLGITITLWGLLPHPEAMSGVLGPLKLIGPAAVGVFFWMQIEDAVIAPAIPPGPRSTAYVVHEGEGMPTEINGLNVRILHADTLSDKRLCGKVSDLGVAYGKATGNPSAGGAFAAASLQNLIVGYKEFGRSMQQVGELVRRCESANIQEGGIVDRQWEKLVSMLARAANDDSLPKRIDRRPFALLKLTDKKGHSTYKIGSPGDEVPAVGRSARISLVAAASKHEGDSQYRSGLVISVDRSRP
jgi:hypothetical protein